jgi:hypothetical protein
MHKYKKPEPRLTCCKKSLICPICKQPKLRWVCTGGNEYQGYTWAQVYDELHHCTNI